MTWTTSNAVQNDPGTGTTPLAVTFPSAIAAGDALVCYLGTTGNNTVAPSLANGGGNTGFFISPGTQSSLVCQLSWTQTVGHAIAVVISHHGLVTQPTITVTDTVGNTYTVTQPAGSFDSGFGNGLAFALATDIRAAGSNVNNVTVSFSGGTPTQIAVGIVEYTACSGLDGTPTATVISGTTPSTSYTTVNDHVLVLQMVFNDTSYTAATGAWTDRSGSSALSNGLEYADQNVTTGGTLVNTSINGASGHNCILIVGLQSGGQGSFGTLSDTSGNVWVPVEGQRTSPGGLCTTWMYAALNVKAAGAGANVLTWTPSGVSTAFVFMQACEVNNSAGKIAFDVSAGATGNNAAPLVSVTANTTTGFQIAGACETGFASTPTVGTSGYTQVLSAGGADALLATLSATSTSATTSGFATGSGGSPSPWNAQILVLRTEAASTTVNQTNANPQQFGQSVTCPFLSLVTPGHLLIAMFTMTAANPGAPTFSGFTDSQGNTWTTDIIEISGHDAGNNVFIQAIGHCIPTKGGTNLQVKASNGDTIQQPCQTAIIELAGAPSLLTVITGKVVQLSGSSVVPSVTLPNCSLNDFVASMHALWNNIGSVGTIGGSAATKLSDAGTNGSLSEYGLAPSTGSLAVTGGTADTEWSIVAADFQFTYSGPPGMPGQPISCAPAM